MFLQMGFPGLTELVVVLMLFLLLAIPAVIAIGVIAFAVRWRSGSEDRDDRIAELEAEVEQLREQVTDDGEGAADEDST